MKVLFVVGYQKEPFNINTWLSKGLGGSEYCVLKLAHKFSDNGHSLHLSFLIDLAIGNIFFLRRLLCRKAYADEIVCVVEWLRKVE